ncbi:MAG: hypothetical protein F4213_03310 [Boseongicola sp. SB0677_bin_26]|nr:hypothetical protein [Boseongicola sp. SB0665_bin_10]MYG25043.1 hypothetical protein [Boseongicola sp. SB0677_bin_26]
MRNILLVVAVLAASQAEAHEGSHGSAACPDLVLSNTVLDVNMRGVERMFRQLPEASRRNLQHLLRHAGFYQGIDDGAWGRKTDCALRVVVGRFAGPMTRHDLADLFDYLLSGGLAGEYPGTPHPVRHPGLID